MGRILRLLLATALVAGAASAQTPAAPPAQAGPTAPTGPAPWRPLPPPVPDDEGDEAVAIRVKRAITVSGEPIDDATILVRGGKIAAIGKIVDVPKGARRVDYSDLVAMPGLVNALSRSALASGARNRGLAGTPGGAKLRDVIDPEDEGLRFALRAGITTVGVIPDPRGGAAAPGAVLRTFGKTGEELVRKDDAFVFFDFEMSTAGKEAIRQPLEKAKEEIDKLEKAPASKPASAPAPPASAPATAPASAPAGGPPRAATAPAAPPKPDPKLELYVKVLKKERKLFVQLSTSSEFLHFQDATWKFDFDRVLFGPSTITTVTEKVVESKSAVLLPAEELTYEPFTRNRMNPAAELRHAGVKIAFLPNIDGRDGFENWLFKVGAIVRNGLSEKDAFEAITRAPAELIGVGDTVGALTAGHAADILFFDGHPFDASTRLRHVMVAGEIVPEDRP